MVSLIFTVPIHFSHLGAFLLGISLLENNYPSGVKISFALSPPRLPQTIFTPAIIFDAPFSGLTDSFAGFSATTRHVPPLGRNGSSASESDRALGSERGGGPGPRGGGGSALRWLRILRAGGGGGGLGGGVTTPSRGREGPGRLPFFHLLKGRCCICPCWL